MSLDVADFDRLHCKMKLNIDVGELKRGTNNDSIIFWHI